MMSAMRGRPSSRRRTPWLKATPSATMASAAAATPPTSPRPACAPAAARREASIVHSPSAKLIIREAR